MANAQSKLEISAHAEMAWLTVKDFAGVCKILPMFDMLECNGNTPGAIRKLASADGVLIERLESLDNSARVLCYSIIEPTTPMSGYVGKIEVRDIGARSGEVAWSSTFEAVGLPDDQVIALLEGIYASGLTNLAKLHS